MLHLSQQFIIISSDGKTIFPSIFKLSTITSLRECRIIASETNQDEKSNVLKKRLFQVKEFEDYGFTCTVRSSQPCKWFNIGVRCSCPFVHTELLNVF